nr:phospholipid carrier-dependent glycosyltransferase [bacterium]
MKKKEFILILLISIISFFTHIVFWSHPQEFVFDEVFFARFAQDYTQGSYFFDQHPPLGKLMLAGMSKIIGIEPYQAEFVIGERFVEPDVAVLRLLPIWAGILLPLVIYGVSRQLKLSLMVSFFAAMLVVFENSIIVQSRFILLDAFLLLFGFSSLYFYLVSRSKHSLKLFAVSIILAAGALSIKWTGATFLFLIFVIEAYKALP